MENIKAKIHTKSNYRNLNGSWLPVHEFKGKLVSCLVADNEAKDGYVIADFSLNEVVEFNSGNTTTVHHIFQQILKTFMP